jgi:hypothetical protein
MQPQRLRQMQEDKMAIGVVCPCEQRYVLGRRRHSMSVIRVMWVLSWRPVCSRNRLLTLALEAGAGVTGNLQIHRHSRMAAQRLQKCHAAVSTAVSMAVVHSAKETS